MRKLNWAIISTGTIAKKFAETAAFMQDEMTLYGVASRNLENAKNFADNYKIPHYFDSYEKMVQDPDIDVVYIGTPHNLHYENMIMCLNHGKHVLCEKSFTVNREQAETVFKLAESKNLFVMEAFWTKFAPVYKDLEKILKTGVIGEINTLTAQFGFKAQGNRLDRKFNPDLAGGALLDIGVYAIGFTCMILGYEPEKILSVVKFNDVNSDEQESILLEFDKGKTAQLITSIGTTLPVFAGIYGTLGHINIDDFKSPQSFQVVLDGNEEYIVEKPFDINGFEYQIREVNRCIVENKISSDIMKPEHTLAVMGIMDKLRKDWNFIYPFER